MAANICNNSLRRGRTWRLPRLPLVAYCCEEGLATIAARLDEILANLSNRPLGWLLRILTNLNIDRGRRVQRTPDLQPLEEGDYFLYNRLESTLADGNPDEERVIERLSQNAVVEALAEVPHDFRDAIVLVDIGEFSYADAAQILDIPVGTVMSRLHRGRRILKQRLAERAVAA